MVSQGQPGRPLASKQESEAGAQLGFIRFSGGSWVGFE
jgi:hypothetical protein